MVRMWEMVTRGIAFALAAAILVGIARKELDWTLHHVETVARVAAVERTCADGRQGRMRWIDCAEALPGATRRSRIELAYLSPADGQEHRTTVRCDTSAEASPEVEPGDALVVLAHVSQAGKADRRRCTTLTEGEAGQGQPDDG
jgi:hypothetical protein